MIGRTLQAGILGFLFAAIYLKIQNLWSIALIHVLFDILLLVPTNLFVTAPENQNSADGWLTYLIMILIESPLIVTSLRILKAVEIPQYGFFKEKWTPRNVINEKKLEEI